MVKLEIGIDVKLFTDNELLEQHKIIKNIPRALIESGMNYVQNAPESLAFNKNTPKFLATKGKYIYKLYLKIYKECLNRGLEVKDYSSLWDIYAKHFKLYKDWVPGEYARKLIEKNKQELLSNRKKIRNEI